MKFSLYPSFGKFWVLIISCLLLLAGCQTTSENNTLVVNVKRVVSGQTLEIGATSAQSGVERVRLIGIESPDQKQQPWGTEAQERLTQLINGKPVSLESDQESKDQFDRRLAYVWRDRTLLNEQMVAEGYALFVPRSPNNKYDHRLARAQEYARIMGLGIWNPQKPMRLTPSEFRHQYR